MDSLCPTEWWSDRIPACNKNMQKHVVGKNCLSESHGQVSGRYLHHLENGYRMGQHGSKSKATETTMVPNFDPYWYKPDILLQLLLTLLVFLICSEWGNSRCCPFKDNDSENQHRHSVYEIGSEVGKRQHFPHLHCHFWGTPHFHTHPNIILLVLSHCILIRS